MSQDYAIRRQANDESRNKAEAHGEIWEAYEIELLEEGWSYDEATLPEIAELLGRTIEACRQKHYDIGRRQQQTTRVKQAKTHHNTAWDRGWSSLEDMGF